MKTLLSDWEVVGSDSTTGMSMILVLSISREDIPTGFSFRKLYSSILRTTCSFLGLFVALCCKVYLLFGTNCRTLFSSFLTHCDIVRLVVYLSKDVSTFKVFCVAASFR